MTTASESPKPLRRVLDMWNLVMMIGTILGKRVMIHANS